MMEQAALQAMLRQARHDLVRAATGGMAPPRAAVHGLETWTEEVALLPDQSLSSGAMAQAWGNLQLVMTECGPEQERHDHAQAWRRVRRIAEEGFIALLARQEWSSLYVDFREEVLPRLADAVGLSRAGRVSRCIEAMNHLRALAHRTSGMPHSWRIRQVAEMQYPGITREGWLARDGLDFTWQRVQAVAHALIQEILITGPVRDPLVVSYDSRVHADQLAAVVTDIATAYGIPVHLAQRDTPTPAAVAYLTDILGEQQAAGLVDCSAGRYPVKDPGAGRYTGHAYHGIRYYLPSGHAPFADMAERINRRAAEWLLDDTETSEEHPTAEVTMFDPRNSYGRHLVDAQRYTVLTAEGTEDVMLDVVRGAWSPPDAAIVVDEMHGTARGYFSAWCRVLALRHEVLHGEVDPIFNGVGTANPEPPYLVDLTARVRELRDERRPLIGLAFDAGARQVGMVDETGRYLPPGAVLAVLVDFLLNEGYPGEPGRIVRGRATTRLLDRIVTLPAYADRVLVPEHRQQLPAYMHAPDYRQLTGDPRLLHGNGVYVTEENLLDAPQAFLIAGNARGEVRLGALPGPDGMWAATLLLQVCAVRNRGLHEIWDALQQQTMPTHLERLELYAPDVTRRALINGYMERYEKTTYEQRQTPEYQLGGCLVQFAGGVSDRYVEWALQDGEGQPAYLSITQLFPEPAIRVEVDARSADVAHRLLMTVAERLESLLSDRLHRAGNPWEVIEILAGVTSPLITATEIPGTLTCRLAEKAYERLQELARPGREAPDLLRFVTDRLRELEPEKARVLAACRLGEETTRPKAPPPPRVHWESEDY